MLDDAELLRLYAETRSEEAFAEVVRRYLPLVHSAALRQTGGDAHRAQEVAQAVFTLLARKAGELRRHPALSGWLHTATYHIAAKERRSEYRRKRREWEAQVMSADGERDDSSVDWARVSPVLDELLQRLKERDRVVVLMRFFENRSYGEIGRRLGLSENAARMRLERSLENLRVALARRGVASTAATLGGALASHAAPPVAPGLVTAIASGTTAAAAGIASGGGFLISLMNMSSLKTGLVGAVIVAGAAGLLVQRQENTHLQEELRALRARLAADIARRAAAPTSQATEMPMEASPRVSYVRARETAAESGQGMGSAVVERVDRLRRLLERSPELGIPEIGLAGEEDWIDAAKGPLETEEDYRRALGTLRNAVTTKFAKLLQPALRRYLEGSDGGFPKSMDELQTHFDGPVDAAIWRRYAVMPAVGVDNVRMGGGLIITQRSLVDSEYDHRFVIGPLGFGSTSPMAAQAWETVSQVTQAYRAANSGAIPADAEQLLPYASTPEQRAVLERAMARMVRRR